MVYADCGKMRSGCKAPNGAWGRWPLLVTCALYAGLMLIPFARTQAATTNPNSGQEQIVSEIVIRLADAPPDLNQEPWLKAARNLIAVRAQEKFSDLKLQAALEALKASKLFETIHADSIPDGEQLKLVFTLSLFRRVRDIRIKGQFPFFQKDILQAMTIFPGSVFSLKDDPQRQQQRITALYHREGFESPRIVVQVEENPAVLTVGVFVQIDKGSFLRLKQLDIDGNNAFSDFALKRRLSVWRAALLPGSSGRFRNQDLKNDIQRLMEHYHSCGYPDVAIDHRLEKMPATGQVNARITIREGQLYKIDFAGNRHFWDRTLRSDLILFKEGNPHDFGIKRSVQNILARYRSAGFPDVTVKTEEKRDAAGGIQVRRISFVIDEGPRRIVASVQIKGNRSVAAKDIFGQLLTRPKKLFHDGALDPDTLEADLYAVKALYLKHGFVDAEVNQTTEPAQTAKNVSVDIIVDEGAQTTVAGVQVIGSRTITENEALSAIQMKPGQPFREYMLQSDKNVLSALISQKGHPYITIDPKVSYNTNRSRVDILYRIDDGPAVFVGDIRFNGIFRTSEDLLRTELMLKSGQPFSLQRLLEGQRNLNNMNIFKSVKVRAVGLKEKAETVHLMVDVEEKKPLYVQASAGYDTERGLYTRARGGDRNFLGRNKDVWLSAELSQIGYRVETGIAEPKLWGWPLSANWNIFGEEIQEFNQNFGTRTTGTSLTLARKWRLRWLTGLGLRLEQRRQFSTDNRQPIGPDEFETRTIAVATPAVRYDTRDSFVRPKRGMVAGLAIDLSTGLDNLDSPSKKIKNLVALEKSSR
ncbi:MAG: BamA/TamA family outer membrane protein [Desulfobacterales bacterium]|nr:BamA/TamA family outer membrane protein [Desulfobacterales bacterium]